VENPYKRQNTRATAQGAVEEERHAEVMQALKDLHQPAVPTAALDERLAAMHAELTSLAAAQKATHVKLLQMSALVTELHRSQDGMAAALLDVLKPHRKRPLSVSAPSTGL
jgi:FKBP-type peptidyl-prolyl cis-trans isomerase (trigger factor)